MLFTVLKCYQKKAVAVAQWLRFCATNRKVAGSIPDGVIGIFHLYHPSDRNMDLESTQPGVFPGGKSGRCVRLTTLPQSLAIATSSGNLNFLEPSGHLGPVMGLIYIFFYQKKRKDLAKNKHRYQDTRCQIRFKPGTFRIFSGRTVHHTSMYVRQNRNSGYRRANTTGDRAAKFCTVTSNTSDPQYGTCLVSPFLAPRILKCVLDFLKNL